MKAPRVASRYSKALLDLAVEQNALDNTRTDAQHLANAVAATPELAMLLKSPVVKADLKNKALGEAFKGQFSPLFASFVTLLVKKGREVHLAEIVAQFEQDVLAHLGIVNANVVSASDLDDKARASLTAKLKEQLGKEVQLNVEVDASLIGGFKLEVDGKMLDKSISGKLNALRNTMIDQKYRVNN